MSEKNAIKDKKESSATVDDKMKEIGRAHV